MHSDVAFGQYYSAESAVHKMDPRIKILLLIAYIVMVFIASNFLALSVTLIFLIVAVAFAKVPIGSVLKSIRAILFLVVFTALLNVFFYNAKAGDTQIVGRIYKEGLISAAFLALRLISLVMGSSLLTLTIAKGATYTASFNQESSKIVLVK